MTRKHTLTRAFLSSAFAVLLCGGLSAVSAQKPSSLSQAPEPPAAGGVRAAQSARRVPARKLIKIKTRAGDTLEVLGDRFGVAADELAVLNGLPVRVQLQQGRELVIPLPTPESLKASAERMAQHNSGSRYGETDSQDVAAGAWENVQGVWFRKGSGARDTAVPASGGAGNGVEAGRKEAKDTGVAQVAKVVEVSETGQSSAPQPVWIYLVGGARVEADSVSETAEGAWYARGNLRIFIERSRIERIERERNAGMNAGASAWTERGWSTGNPKFDVLIRENGARFGVDPYLIFCVMEQESHFKPWVVSPKGAKGLMQLMPGTAAYLGVRKPFDPADNIMGGTKYLKQLLEQFGGRVDLVLAGYNAGEGAVLKYGGRVPPYKETRTYVQRISKRYGQNRSSVAGTVESPVPGAGLR